jgi:hypothetical protein
MSSVRKLCPFVSGRTIRIVRLSLVLVRCLDRLVVERHFLVRAFAFAERFFFVKPNFKFFWLFPYGFSK